MVKLPNRHVLTMFHHIELVPSWNREEFLPEEGRRNACRMMPPITGQGPSGSARRRNFLPRFRIYGGQSSNMHTPPIESSSTCLKPRAVLTKDQVIHIFRMSIEKSNNKARPSATAVAKQYSVSEKTIRDIWRARTWHDETLPLDMHRPFQNSMKSCIEN